jgi:hypothetical protein
LSASWWRVTSWHSEVLPPLRAALVLVRGRGFFFIWNPSKEMPKNSFYL